MTLYVVRHGESETNVQGRWGGQYDTPLTEKGIEQAKQLSSKLTSVDLDVIISSSLTRALQTAEEVQKVSNVPLVSSDEFIERNMGVYEGLTQDEIIERYPDLWDRQCSRKLDDAPTNGETYLQFYARITGALLKLEQEYSGKNVLLVTHSFVARVINWHYKKLRFEDIFGYKLGNCKVEKYTI